MEHHDHWKERGLGVLIAKDAGVSPQSVSEWKKLLTAASEPQLMRLAAVYGVSAEELSGLQPERQSSDLIFEGYDEFKEKAVQLMGAVTSEVLPEGAYDEFVAIAEKAQDLLLEGRSEDEAYGILFRFVVDLKKAREKGNDHQPA